jgi:hypothetical protein
MDLKKMRKDASLSMKKASFVIPNKVRNLCQRCTSKILRCAQKDKITALRMTKLLL